MFTKRTNGSSASAEDANDATNNPAERRGRPTTSESKDKTIQWLSIGGVAASVLCLFVFFQSDIPDKIAFAKAQENRMAQSAPATSVPGNDVVVGDDDAQQNDGATDSANGSGGDNLDSQPAPSEPTVSITPADVLDPIQLADYLRELPESEFALLAESMKDPGETGGELVDFQTLEAAYAEAEAKYPGQIDGSKRLKLIAEINAIDYLYYVAEDGDTLLELSKAFGVPLGQLIELNGIQDADVIPAGMIILFPTDTKQ